VLPAMAGVISVRPGPVARLSPRRERCRGVASGGRQDTVAMYAGARPSFVPGRRVALSHRVGADQTEPVGSENGLFASAHAELAVDVIDMRLDG